MAQDERAEIEEAVGQALADLGVSGTIAITGDSMELQSTGAPVSIEIELTIRQWPLLPPDMRRRKAAEVASRLAGAHRAATAASRTKRDSLGPPTRIAGAIAAVIGLLVLIGAVRFALPRLNPEKVEAKGPSENDDARRERLARACDSMRTQIYNGAKLTPMATEGWVVELWLANRHGATLKDNAALTGLISGGKLTAAGDDELAHVIDGTVEIADGFSEEMGHRSAAWGGAILVFREGYARVFLEPETRQRFVLLADRLADAVGAEAGALYARCAHLTTHDIGAWFHGVDAPGAAASMVYQMGYFAEGSVLDRGAITAIRTPGGELDALRKAAVEVDHDLLPKLVTAQGGTVNTAHGTSFVFPLGGPSRALTATKTVARRMGIGVGTD